MTKFWHGQNLLIFATIYHEWMVIQNMMRTREGNKSF